MSTRSASTFLSQLTDRFRSLTTPAGNDDRQLPSETTNSNYVYPDVGDPAFASLLAQHKAFYDTRSRSDDPEEGQEQGNHEEETRRYMEALAHPATDVFVRQFLKSNTPYARLLLYYSPGTDIRSLLQQLGTIWLVYADEREPAFSFLSSSSSPSSTIVGMTMSTFLLHASSVSSRCPLLVIDDIHRFFPHTKRLRRFHQGLLAFLASHRDTKLLLTTSTPFYHETEEEPKWWMELLTSSSSSSSSSWQTRLPGYVAYLTHANPYTFPLVQQKELENTTWVELTQHRGPGLLLVYASDALVLMDIVRQLDENTPFRNHAGAPHRYAVISSTDFNRDTLALTLSPQNQYGTVIRLVVLQGALAEEIVFPNVRQVHLVGSFGRGRATQILARSAYERSHVALAYEERNVCVYRESKGGNEEKEGKEGKEEPWQQWERTCQATSVNCTLRHGVAAKRTSEATMVLSTGETVVVDASSSFGIGVQHETMVCSGSSSPSLSTKPLETMYQRNVHERAFAVNIEQALAVLFAEQEEYTYTALIRALDARFRTSFPIGAVFRVLRDLTLREDGTLLLSREGDRYRVRKLPLIRVKAMVPDEEPYDSQEELEDEKERKRVLFQEQQEEEQEQEEEQQEEKEEKEREATPVNPLLLPDTWFQHLQKVREHLRVVHRLPDNKVMQYMNDRRQGRVSSPSLSLTPIQQVGTVVGHVDKTGEFVLTVLDRAWATTASLRTWSRGRQLRCVDMGKRDILGWLQRVCDQTQPSSKGKGKGKGIETKTHCYNDAQAELFSKGEWCVLLEMVMRAATDRGPIRHMV